MLKKLKNLIAFGLIPSVATACINGMIKPIPAVSKIIVIKDKTTKKYKDLICLFDIIIFILLNILIFYF